MKKIQTTKLSLKKRMRAEKIDYDAINNRTGKERNLPFLCDFVYCHIYNASE